ncbi:MAG: hypothetical protein ACQKBT_09555 [Puniceicoccales bacterium]
MSIFSILLLVAIHLVPESVDSFTIEDTDASQIECVHLDDGGWEATDPSGEIIGTFYIQDAQVTMRGDDKEFTFALNEILGMPELPDWDTMQEVSFGQIRFPIVRVENGFDFVLSPQGDAHRIKVRWNQPGEPAPTK